eukprot:m.317455 g.317455  ORF g.317455 m.317455 type:complete len:234 (-) comp19688_c0_seq7:2685-3386(-)
MADAPPTPQYSHLWSEPKPLPGHDTIATPKTYEDVYEPSEDSFLFLDALHQEAPGLATTIGAGDVCAEVGCGSGVVITYLAQLLGPLPTYRAIDVNPAAVHAALTTAALNNVTIDVFQGDLVAPLNDVAGKVKVLLFNPPYVVTESSEVGGTGISAAWAGGVHGREVTDRLLPLVPDVLASDGVFYLLALKENLCSGTSDDLTKAIPGFGCRTVLSRRAQNEHLSILAYTRNP